MILASQETLVFQDGQVLMELQGPKVTLDQVDHQDSQAHRASLASEDKVHLDLRDLQVLLAHQGCKAFQVRKEIQVLQASMFLVLQVTKEPQAIQGPLVSQDLRVHLDHRAGMAFLDFQVPKVRWVSWEPLGLQGPQELLEEMAFLAQKVIMDYLAHLGLLDQ